MPFQSLRPGVPYLPCAWDVTGRPVTAQALSPLTTHAKTCAKSISGRGFQAYQKL